MAFRIYTKTGDGGETALFGGKRLPKDHIRIESYGTIDELNSYLGLVKGLILLTAIKLLAKFIVLAIVPQLSFKYLLLP